MRYLSILSHYLFLITCQFMGTLYIASGVSFSPTVAQSSSHCVISAKERHLKKIIRIGVILPYGPQFLWRMQLVRPAIEYARDNIYTSSNLLKNFTIEFDYRDSKCSQTDGPLQAIDLYTTRSADVFLGPACDYAISPIASFSGSWNIPIITAGALVHAFGQKAEYRLLTRVLGAYKQAGEFFQLVLKSFNYTKIGFLLNSGNDAASTYWRTIEVIFLMLKESYIPDLSMKSVESFGREPHNFEKKLTDLSKHCRGETNYSFIIFETSSQLSSQSSPLQTCTDITYLPMLTLAPTITFIIAYLPQLKS